MGCSGVWRCVVVCGGGVVGCEHEEKLVEGWCVCVNVRVCVCEGTCVCVCSFLEGFGWALCTSEF